MKRFLKRMMLNLLMTVIIVMVGSLTFMYVVPAVMSGEMPAAISGGIDRSKEITQDIAHRMTDATDAAVTEIRDNPATARSVKTVQGVASNVTESLPIPAGDRPFMPSGDLAERTDTPTIKSIPRDPIHFDRVISGTVTKIVDGDTIDIEYERVRLVLVNTPERGEPGYAEAKRFTEQQCPVGSPAIYDPDSGQSGGSYGRVIATVWCFGSSYEAPEMPLNAMLLQYGHAELLPKFCRNSEFAGSNWAKAYGC